MSYSYPREKYSTDTERFESVLEQAFLCTPKPKRCALMRKVKRAANRAIHCGSGSPDSDYSQFDYAPSATYPPGSTIVIQQNGSSPAATPFVPSLPLNSDAPVPGTVMSSYSHAGLVGPPVQHHASHMPPPVPIIPTVYRGSPTSKAVNPWESEDYDNVLDGKYNPLALADVAFAINPMIVAAVTDPFPLIVDMRLSKSMVWKRPKPGYDEVPELWKGLNEAATLPRINFMLLICPWFEVPLRIENKSGITCGDVIHAIFDFAQAQMEPERWQALPYLEKQDARNLAPTMRAPHLGWSALNTDSFVNIDTWHGHSTFVGIKRDAPYVKKRLGWANPTCFIVELAKPVHSFRSE